MSGRQEFDWKDNPAVFCRAQQPMAVYENEDRQVVLRQRRDWCDDEDGFVFIAPQNVIAVARALFEVTGLPLVIAQRTADGRLSEALRPVAARRPEPEEPAQPLLLAPPRGAATGDLFSEAAE